MLCFIPTVVAAFAEKGEQPVLKGKRDGSYVSPHATLGRDCALDRLWRDWFGPELTLL